MDDIITTVGVALDRSQKRKREGTIALLRSIYTRPGMIVLGRDFAGCGAGVDLPADRAGEGSERRCDRT